ncbi:MAG TPA: 50S ribosomal protein L6, partial [Candidatus Scalindua sp.]|nr:50S ribosomal protein L6 [Candidatus Scalindua sp.]
LKLFLVRGTFYQNLLSLLVNLYLQPRMNLLCQFPFRPFNGLIRTLLANNVHGVTNGFSKDLEIIGIGYNAKLQGKDLVLQLGFSHPVKVEIPQGIKVEIKNQTNPGRLTIMGIDKQLVGQFTANIRSLRPPEPYKGKGIKYADEIIRRKAGKAVAAST